MGQIYLITNKINNHKYVGLTTSSITKRWREHINEALNGNASHSLLHKAILKYGADNFDLEILEECDSSVLNQKEQYYINLYQTHYSLGHGYNLTYGGEGTIRYTDEEILALWDEGYTQSEIAFKLNANINTICQRLQILRPGEARTRYTQKRFIMVEQYTLDGLLIKVWPSITHAASSINNDSGGIVRCCKHERHTFNNYIWKYATDITPIEDLVLAYALSTSCSEVDLIDDDGNVLKTYPSGKSAEIELGLARGKVSEVCNHKYGRKSAGGYKFQWHNALKRNNIKS